MAMSPYLYAWRDEGLHKLVHASRSFDNIVDLDVANAFIPGKQIQKGPVSPFSFCFSLLPDGVTRALSTGPDGRLTAAFKTIARRISCGPKSPLTSTEVGDADSAVAVAGSSTDGR
jgi:hypothetical protein